MNIKKYLQNKCATLFLILTFVLTAQTKAVPSIINDYKYSLGLGIISGGAFTRSAFKIYKANAIKHNLPWSYSDFIQQYPTLFLQALTSEETLNKEHPHFCAAAKLLPIALAGTIALEKQQEDKKNNNDTVPNQALLCQHCKKWPASKERPGSLFCSRKCGLADKHQKPIIPNSSAATATNQAELCSYCHTHPRNSNGKKTSYYCSRECGVLGDRQRKNNKTASLAAAASASAVSTQSIQIKDFTMPSNTSVKAIQRPGIFQKVTGVTEQQFAEAAKSKYQKPRGAGDFYLKTVKELRESADTAIANNTSLQNGVVSMTTYNWKEATNHRWITDIGAEQANPANQGHAFQVASQLKCLDGSMKFGGLNTGQKNGFNSVIGSHAVQGEEAVGSAAPGTIDRLYNPEIGPVDIFNRVKDDYEKMARAQSDADINNCIDALYIGVQKNTLVTTGYSCVDREELNKRTNEEKGKNLEKFDRDNNYVDYNVLIDNAEQKITQIFVATLKLNGSLDFLPEAVKTDTKLLANCTQNILNGMYLGTILAAWDAGITDVHLTLIGGGAFANDPTLIANAIKKTMPYIQGLGMNVRIMFYHIGDYKITNTSDDTAYKLLREMVKATSGTIKHYDNPDAPVIENFAQAASAATSVTTVTASASTAATNAQTASAA